MIRFEDITPPTPPAAGRATARTATLPHLGVELLTYDFHDGLPHQVMTRPIGADGWQQWSPPVELEEVPEAGL